MNTRFYSGLSGLQLKTPRHLYPELFRDSSRLTYYASLFNSIEINSCFYKVPLSSTIIKWMNSVGDNFKFTFKFWKEVTHVKELNFEEYHVNKFLDVIGTTYKNGCLLLQFPPSLTIQFIHQFRHLMDVISKWNLNKDWKVAVEFRNTSWYDEELYGMLNTYNFALVKQDIPRSATPFIDDNSDFVYVRFHGPSGNYRDSYSEAFLEEYATYIVEWMNSGKTVFVYFNNTMGDAFDNLTLLNNIVLRKAENSITFS